MQRLMLIFFPWLACAFQILCVFVLEHCLPVRPLLPLPPLPPQQGLRKGPGKKGRVVGAPWLCLGPRSWLLRPPDPCLPSHSGAWGPGPLCSHPLVDPAQRAISWWPGHFLQLPALLCEPHGGFLCPGSGWGPRHISSSGARFGISHADWVLEALNADAVSGCRGRPGSLDAGQQPAAARVRRRRPICCLGTRIPPRRACPVEPTQQVRLSRLSRLLVSSQRTSLLMPGPRHSVPGGLLGTWTVTLGWHAGTRCADG